MSTLVGFSKPRKMNPLSALIMKLTGSKASHAFFIYFDQDYRTEVVMEASAHGFRHIPLGAFVNKNEIVKVIEPDFPIDEGLRWVALNYLGSSYSWGELIGMAFVLMGRMFKQKYKNPFSSKKSMFCSEAVVVALQQSMYPGSEALVANETSPADLLQFLDHDALND